MLQPICLINPISYFHLCYQCAAWLAASLLGLFFLLFCWRKEQWINRRGLTSRTADRYAIMEGLFVLFCALMVNDIYITVFDTSVPVCGYAHAHCRSRSASSLADDRFVRKPAAEHHGKVPIQNRKLASSWFICLINVTSRGSLKNEEQKTTEQRSKRPLSASFITAVCQNLVIFQRRIFFQRAKIWNPLDKSIP